jgi:hypothetical protein
MSKNLRDQIGSIAGAWALHRKNFLNYPMVIFLGEDGKVYSSIDRIKTWQISGSSLLFFDDQYNPLYSFEFKRQQEYAVLLEGKLLENSLRYLLRSCGTFRPLTKAYQPGQMPKANEVNFMEKLSAGGSFAVELAPMEDGVAQVVKEFTYDSTGKNLPITQDQLYTMPPVFFRVVPHAKVIGGFVIQNLRGHCLAESATTSDICTAENPNYNVYLDDGLNGQWYYDSKSRIDHIDGICFYLDNGAGIDHIYLQCLACVHILDWLEKAGLDFSKVKFLLRKGFINADHEAAFKVSGWFDKVPKDAIIDLSKYSPIVSCDTIIYPSYQWIVSPVRKPENFAWTVLPVSKSANYVFENVKARVLASNLKRSKIPMFMILRRNTRRPRLLNEVALLKALEPLGIVGVDTAEFNFEEKVRLFHGARFIVGCQGAGFVHAVFCEPGTFVHTIFNDTIMYEMHKTICHRMDLKFSCSVYPTEILPDDDDYYPLDRCFYANVDEVVANVKKILAQPEFDDLRSQ